jgi:hypothetical protein
MARNGKIARLPLHIRNELNKRLSDGDSGVKLVRWLNEEVSFFLHNDFESRRLRITGQNLSEWRQGGYQDWLRHMEARQFIQDLAERAGELDQAADGKGISDRFGALLAVDLARLAQKFLEQEADPEKRWERLKEISKELSRLRRDEHRAMWTCIKREQWERQQKQEDDEAEEKMRRRERVEALFDGLRETAPVPARPVRSKSSRPKVRSKPEDASGRSLKPKVAGKAEVLEDTPASGTGRMAAPGALLPEGHHSEEKASEPIQPNPGKSGRIKPNQGKVRTDGAPAKGTESKRIQPNPTKSKFEHESPVNGQPQKVERSCGSQTRGPAESGPDGPPGPKPVGNANIVADRDASGAVNVAASGTDALRLNQSKSDQIQPNPTKPGLKNVLSKTSSPSSLPSPPGEGETLAASSHEPASGGTESRSQGGGQSIQPENENPPRRVQEIPRYSGIKMIRRCRPIERNEPVERTHDFRGEPI